MAFPVGVARRGAAAALRWLPAASQRGGAARGFGSDADAVPERLQRVATPEIGQLLGSQGFAVVDGVFGEELSARLRQEVVSLRGTPLFHSNSTHLVTDGETHLLRKSNIWEAEAMAKDVQEASPLFRALQEDATLMTMLNVVLPSVTLTSQAIKLQSNEGGCFPVHSDSDELLDDRRITAIFYLNAGWEPSHGGQLRLYPFPLSPPIDVPPVNDRVVLFSATRMPHRVLPSSAAVQRCCFTCWLSNSPHRSRAQSGRLSSAEPPLEGLTPAQAAAFLLHPSVRKHLVKLVHGREWRQSLRESHPEGAALDAYLETHDRGTALIARRLAPYLEALLPGATADSLLAAGDGAPAEALAAALRKHSSPQAVEWF